MGRPAIASDGDWGEWPGMAFRDIHFSSFRPLLYVLPHTFSFTTLSWHSNVHCFLFPSIYFLSFMTAFHSFCCLLSLFPVLFIFVYLYLSLVLLYNIHTFIFWSLLWLFPSVFPCSTDDLGVHVAHVGEFGTPNGSRREVVDIHRRWISKGMSMCWRRDRMEQAQNKFGVRLLWKMGNFWPVDWERASK
jgi:hypothetical protein